MKAGILLSISLASLAGLAQAQCLDTLYLKELTVYSMSLVNSKTKVAWTETKVDPWNQDSYQAAGAPVPAPFKALFPFSDTVVHPRVLHFSCGAERSNSLSRVSVVDENTGTAGKVAFERKISTDVFNVGPMARYSPAWLGDTSIAANFYFLYWYSDSRELIIGVKDSLGDTVSYQAFASGVSKDRASGYYNMNRQGTYLHPSKSYTESQVVGWLDNSFAQKVDGIASGSIDSTWMEMRVYGYKFSKTKPSASSVLNGPRGVMNGFEMSNGGVQFALNVPRTVSIVSPSGRVVRRLDAARNVVWDLRDQAGVRVQPGVWFVQVQGLKTVPVVVR